MLNLFDTETYNEISTRLEKLSAETNPAWGKMNAAQMLAHCKEAFMIPLSQKKLPRHLLGLLLGPFFKAKLYNDVPWRKNLPTSPNFKITNERKFDEEKEELITLVRKFYAAGPMGISKFPHPMFGKFTPEQWGKSMYKHLDHHLRQFNS